MSKVYAVLGDVKNKGKFEIEKDITIKDVLDEYAGGMNRVGKVKLVQIGGPLGECVKGSDLNNKVSVYDNLVSERTLMYFSELFCPVDYARFLTRYVIRELRIDNQQVRALNELIESAAQGNARDNILEDMLELICSTPLSDEEKKLFGVIKFVIDEFKDEFVEHVKDKKCKNGVCRGLFIAQCMNECPAEVYIPGYIELMKNGKTTEAYQLMRENNPLSFVCGKVCARPCESRCRRGEIESTVGVRALKRYAADMALKVGDFKETKLKSIGKKVAVVGAGPAGLTAAYYLAKTGYEVVVYEASEVVGGMLAVGIPEYRLPQATIDKEVQLIKSLGVKIITNTKVGVDVALTELRSKYDSVLLTTGCHIGNKFGPETKDIETAIELLKDVKVRGRRKIGKNVLIIGGGDVALDAARTAIRLGASKVAVASLESFEEMPASDEEKRESLREGIEFISGYGNKEILMEAGKLKSITLKKCLSVLGDEGEFAPVYDEEATKKIEIDSLILAIGQRSDISYLDKDIQKNERGWIQVDKYSFMTNIDGVFSAGDMCSPGTAIKAIAEGKKAATSIDKHLGGNGLFVDTSINVSEKPLNCATWDIEKIEEVQSEDINLMGNFDLVSKVFTKEEAKQEADRCMRCDLNSRRPLHLK